MRANQTISCVTILQSDPLSDKLSLVSNQKASVTLIGSLFDSLHRLGWQPVIAGGDLRKNEANPGNITQFAGQRIATVGSSIVATRSVTSVAATALAKTLLNYPYKNSKSVRKTQRQTVDSSA